jgi:hypothetical protein
LERADLSEEYVASIFRVGEYAKSEPVKVRLSPNYMASLPR